MTAPPTALVEPVAPEEARIQRAAENATHKERALNVSRRMAQELDQLLVRIPPEDRSDVELAFEREVPPLVREDTAAYLEALANLRDAVIGADPVREAVAAVDDDSRE